MLYERLHGLVDDLMKILAVGFNFIVARDAFIDGISFQESVAWALLNSCEVDHRDDDFSIIYKRGAV